MTISLSEQLESDIKAYLHKTFGTYFSSLDERFAADIKEDVINASDFHHGYYNDDDISIAFQRVTLGGWDILIGKFTILYGYGGEYHEAECKSKYTDSHQARFSRGSGPLLFGTRGGCRQEAGYGRPCADGLRIFRKRILPHLVASQRRPVQH